MLDSFEWTILIFAVVLTGLNVIGCGLSVRHYVNNYKSYHPNQLFLRSFHVFICTLTSVTIAVCGITLLVFEESVYGNMPPFFRTFYKVLATLFSACALCVRLASFGLTLERLIATFLSSSYEKRCANACIGCFVAIGELCLCGVFSFFYHMNIWGFMTHLSIVTFLDALNVVGLLLLIKQNKSLRKINTLSDIVLSQRYQITENLKTLFELQPMLLSQSLFLVLGTSSGFICSSLHTSRFYVDWSFYVLMNLSVLVLFTAAYIQRKMKAANWKRKVNDQSGVVVNALGQVMEAQQTHNEYFNNLKDQWN